MGGSCMCAPGRWYCSGGARKDVDLFLYDLSREGAIKKITDIYNVRSHRLG